MKGRQTAHVTLLCGFRHFPHPWLTFESKFTASVNHVLNPVACPDLPSIIQRSKAPSVLSSSIVHSCYYVCCYADFCWEQVCLCGLFSLLWSLSHLLPLRLWSFPVMKLSITPSLELPLFEPSWKTVTTAPTLGNVLVVEALISWLAR